MHVGILHASVSHGTQFHSRRAHVVRPQALAVPASAALFACASQLTLPVSRALCLPRVAVQRRSTHDFVLRPDGLRRRREPAVGVGSEKRGGDERRSKRDERWHARRSELSSFMRAKGRLPSQATQNRTERSLYTWLYSQQRGYRAGKRSPRRSTWLDDDIDVKRAVQGNAWEFGWISREERWRAKFGEVTAFICCFGRSPCFSRRDLTECSLRCWLHRQRAMGRPLPECDSSFGDSLDVKRILQRFLRQVSPDEHSHALDMKSALQANASWLGQVSQEERWHARCSELASFMRTDGRLPSQAARIRAERSLYKWLYSQRRMYRAGRLSPERAKWLDDSQGLRFIRQPLCFLCHCHIVHGFFLDLWLELTHSDVWLWFS